MDISQEQLVNICRRYKHMSYRNLKDELKRCAPNSLDNIVIRKIMKSKIIEHKQRKEKRIEKEDTVNIDELFEFLEQDDYEDNSDNQTGRRGNGWDDVFFQDKMVEPLNELEGDGFNNKRGKFKKEIAKDSLNNSLMNRMNSELDIQNFRRRSGRKDFIPPFADDIGDKFAPFHSLNKGPKDFSNAPL